MSATAERTPVVALSGIAKRFPGVQALDDVSVELRAGEVLGLAGENGSGKSTLMKVLAGRYNADAGGIQMHGRDVHWGTAAAALHAGVALIAQEVLVHPDLTVAENLMFGQMPRRAGVVRWGAAERDVADTLARLGLDVDPGRRLGTLALNQQHMVAIGKMVRRRPEVLLLDEPTASLTEDQVETLFGLVRELRAGGTSIVYITHRLREYFELCDRVAVLRDGVHVATRPTAELDEPELVRLMVGRELSSVFERPAKPAPARDAAPALRVRELSTPGKLRDVSFDVRRGEIVGIAGQSGAGRSTLCRALFGVAAYEGTVEIEGAVVRLRSARDAIRAGVALVPEDRKGQGLVLDASVHENLTMPSWGATARLGIRSRGREEAIAREAVQRLSIRTASTSTPAAALSGGNQQKLVIGKWIARRPKLLVLDEPTRGVDVGAKAELYKLIDELAAAGMGVLVASSELLELMRLCDRILVMAGGRIVGEQTGAEATEESITHLAFTGLHDTNEVEG
jgi:ABC-type sugar transport system ATPase subunit